MVRPTSDEEEGRAGAATRRSGSQSGLPLRRAVFGDNFMDALIGIGSLTASRWDLPAICGSPRGTAVATEAGRVASSRVKGGPLKRRDAKLIHPPFVRARCPPRQLTIEEFGEMGRPARSAR